MLTQLVYLFYLELLAGASVREAIHTVSRIGPSFYRPGLENLLATEEMGLAFEEAANLLSVRHPELGLQLLVFTLKKLEISDWSIDSRISVAEIFAPIFQVLPPRGDEVSLAEPVAPTNQSENSRSILEKFIAACVELDLGFVLMEKCEETSSFLTKMQAKVLEQDIFHLPRNESLRLQKEFPLIIAPEMKGLKEWCGWRNGRPLLQTLIHFQQLGMDRNRKIIGTYYRSPIVPSFLISLEIAGKNVPRSILMKGAIPPRPQGDG
ncbi:MAG: hypothetical protein KGP28_05820 [Bdellovibrionales bacterium]|nr:hypothetical protein [Bdellovibrionales bacterium]